MENIFIECKKMVIDNIYGHQEQKYIHQEQKYIHQKRKYVHWACPIN